MKKLVTAIGVMLTLVAAMLLFNYFSAHSPVQRAISEDSRNEKVRVWSYHRFGVMPGDLVFDLRSFDDSAAPLDVIRTLLHAASGLKERKFDRVVLAYQGTPKLFLRGDYFQTLGQEYGQQNPVYTLRTLPENVYRLDGTPAYGTWTGGILGVLGKQMEDLGKLSQDWFLKDAVSAH